MRGMQMKSLWGARCGQRAALHSWLRRDAERTQAFARRRRLSTQQAGSPVVVSCEPNQRTLVRPVVVNGATMSQVECVVGGSAGGRVRAGQRGGRRRCRRRYGYAAQPVVYTRSRARAGRAGADARPAARPVRTRQVVYDEPVGSKKRSVKKSAVIIGSSAAVGAGVGAAGQAARRAR